MSSHCIYYPICVVACISFKTAKPMCWMSEPWIFWPPCFISCRRQNGVDTYKWRFWSLIKYQISSNIIFSALFNLLQWTPQACNTPYCRRTLQHSPRPTTISTPRFDLRQYDITISPVHHNLSKSQTFIQKWVWHAIFRIQVDIRPICFILIIYPVLHP